MPIYTRNGTVANIYARGQGTVDTVRARVFELDPVLGPRTLSRTVFDSNSNNPNAGPVADWVSAEALNADFGLPLWSGTRSYYPLRNTVSDPTFSTWQTSSWGANGSATDFYVFIANDGLYTNTSIENTASMFRNNTTFNDSDIALWDTSNITSMLSMFQGATAFNRDISGWDVSNVTDSRNMFFNASAFNQDISGWDLTNSTSMSGMFQGANAFNQDIGGWDVSGVINMTNTFTQASAFNQDISGWDTSNVTSMAGLFESASAFNQDISGWNVSNVDNMQAMFYEADAFNQDISGWNVSNVTRMRLMFSLADAFNQDISGWNVDNVTDATSFSLNAGQKGTGAGNWTEAEHPTSATLGTFYST